MDAQQIAQQFVQHYYTTFDSNRQNLVSLYQSESMLTYEGTTVKTPQEIVAKLCQINAQKLRHKINTSDIQPTGAGILIYVTGSLSVDDGPEMPFSEVFHLLPTNQGGFWLLNQVFRFAFA